MSEEKSRQTVYNSEGTNINLEAGILANNAEERRKIARRLIHENIILTETEKESLLEHFEKVWKLRDARAQELHERELGEKYMCNLCNNERCINQYCAHCMRKALTDNFPNWDSGSEALNKIIRDCQIKNPIPQLFVEWIPFESFQNVDYLDKGGFGKVYKAEWVNSEIYDWDEDNQQFLRRKNVKVALKTLGDGEIPSDAFFKEAEVCTKLIFGEIIRCYGFTKNKEGVYMIVMNLYEGGSLKDRLERSETLRWKEKAEIIYCISQGLNIIHSRGLAHKDFHSGNILGTRMLSKYIVSDLGVCGPVTETEKTVGVLPYLAPEIFQKEKHKKYTKETDIYSLGILMWEVSAGYRPFSTVENASSFMYDVINGLRPDVTPGTPKEYTDLMIRCWDADPSKRPTAEEVNQRMKAWLRDIINGTWTWKPPNTYSSFSQCSKVLEVPNDLPQPTNAFPGKKLDTQVDDGVQPPINTDTITFGITGPFSRRMD